MEDIQQQLDASFDFLAGKVHNLQRTVFWTNVVVVCLALDRLCTYFF